MLMLAETRTRALVCLRRLFIRGRVGGVGGYFWAKQHKTRDMKAVFPCFMFLSPRLSLVFLQIGETERGLLFFSPLATTRFSRFHSIQRVPRETGALATSIPMLCCSCRPPISSRPTSVNPLPPRKPAPHLTTTTTHATHNQPRSRPRRRLGWNPGWP